VTSTRTQAVPPVGARVDGLHILLLSHRRLMDVWFALPYGPLLIFAMRIVDVSMGAVRILLMMRGRRGGAAAVGFVEVLIWVVAVGNAMQHLSSPYHLAGYAGGFAMGTYVGVSVERALALGRVVVRAILPAPEGTGRAAAQLLREEGYAVTEMEGRGRSGPVTVLNVVVARRHASAVAERIESVAPAAFITVEEIRTSRGGMLRPLPTSQALKNEQVRK